MVNLDVRPCHQQLNLLNILKCPLRTNFLHHRFLILKFEMRFFIQGNALLRRLVRIGVLDENRMKLDYVLGLKIEDFLERRLETQVSLASMNITFCSVGIAEN